MSQPRSIKWLEATLDRKREFAGVAGRLGGVEWG